MKKKNLSRILNGREQGTRVEKEGEGEEEV